LFDHRALTIWLLLCKTRDAFSKNFTDRALTPRMSIEELRRRAANCLRWAQEAANERTKALWLSMAQIWLDRAERLRTTAGPQHAPVRVNRR
jgi:hypothetical protein